MKPSIHTLQSTPFLPSPISTTTSSGTPRKKQIPSSHAYLILTPMGLEIFPFFRPAKGMQMVFWQEIRAAEIDERGKWLTLHFNEERTAGMHLSLSPVRKKLRELLAKAVLGRVKL